MRLSSLSNMFKAKVRLWTDKGSPNNLVDRAMVLMLASLLLLQRLTR
jgi:hypothetical protein